MATVIVIHEFLREGLFNLFELYYFFILKTENTKQGLSMKDTNEANDKKNVAKV